MNVRMYRSPTTTKMYFAEDSALDRVRCNPAQFLILAKITPGDIMQWATDLRQSTEWIRGIAKDRPDILQHMILRASSRESGPGYVRLVERVTERMMAAARHTEALIVEIKE